MQIIIIKKDTLIYDEFKFKCSVGKNGITSKKVEGDNKTPEGLYALGPLYYRKDRFPKPSTKLKKIEIKKNFGWCDDVKSKFYNKPIKTNKKVGMKNYIEMIENMILSSQLNIILKDQKKIKVVQFFCI